MEEKNDGGIKDFNEKSLLAPHRLTIAEARERLIDSLKVIKAHYPAFQKACSDGLEVFKNEGVKAFESRSYPVIKAEADALRVHVDAVKALPALLGFSEPEMKAKLDPFLRQIAEEAKVDKVLISFRTGFYYDFSYTSGFTDEEIMNFRLQNDEIFDVISNSGIQMSPEKIAKGMNALRSAGMVSALDVSTDAKWLIKIEDSYISIVIGRSAQGVSLNGELTDNDRKALATKLNAFVRNGQAPWYGVRKFLDDNQYKTFDDFMYFLRHNSGIGPLKEHILPIIYNNIPELLKGSPAQDGRIQQRDDHIIGNMVEVLKQTQLLGNVETFLQLLEKGAEFKSWDISGEVHQRVASFKGMAEDKKLKLDISGLTNEALIVPACDLNWLDVVVDNLLQNAIKYTSAGAVKVRLSKKMMHAEDPDLEQAFAVLEVEDTGIGVPADERVAVLERGYRATNAIAAKIKGTGIGLDAVSTILRLMQGDITVEPGENGIGSKFIVRLPLVQDPSQDQAEVPLPGGIDLNPAQLDLKTQNSGGEIAFNLDPTLLARLQNASGISPVIVSVRPLDSISAFMGIQKPVK